MLLPEEDRYSQFFQTRALADESILLPVRIGLQDLRGSGSLASVPNLVVALERDRQSPDPEIAHTSVIRVLKNRFTGNVGVASALRYDQRSGRMYEVEFIVDPDGNVTFGGPYVETSI